MWCGWCQQRCCSRFKISSMLSKMLLMLSRMLSSKVVSPSLLRRPEPTGGSWCQMDIHVSTGVHHGGTTSILSNLPSAQPSRHPSRHEADLERHTRRRERRTRSPPPTSISDDLRLTTVAIFYSKNHLESTTIAIFYSGIRLETPSNMIFPLLLHTASTPPTSI